MNSVLKVFLISVVIACSFASESRSAQDGIVIVDQSPIHSEPKKSSVIIEFKSRGEKIKTSNETRDGWFHVRASNGKLGWMSQDAISIGPKGDTFTHLEDEDHQKRRSNKPPWFYFRIGPELAGIMNPEVSYDLGLGYSHVYLGTGFFSELAFSLSERVRLAIRGSYYYSSGTISYTAAGLGFGTTYKIANSGFFLLAGVDVDVLRTEYFDFTFGLFAGGSLFNRLKVTAPDLADPNGFSISKPGWAFFGDITVKHWFKSWIALVAEIGGYYSKATAQSPDSAFNGDTPFRDANGNLQAINSSQRGPMFGVGLELAF